VISGNTTTPTADGSNARAVAGQVATGGAGFTEGTSGNTTKASAVGADSHVFAIASNTQVPCRVPDRNPGGGGTTREPQWSGHHRGGGERGKHHRDGERDPQW